VRLIDADALDKMLADAQTECKRNGGNFRVGVLSNVRENIADFPTIDAIPVEWLVSWINRHPNDLRCVWFVSLEMEWRKEQEAR